MIAWSVGRTTSLVVFLALGHPGAAAIESSTQDARVEQGTKRVGLIQDKHERMSGVLGLVSTVHTWAGEEYAVARVDRESGAVERSLQRQDLLRSKIRSAVSRLHSREVLTTGLMFRGILVKQDFEDEHYDLVVDFGYWACVQVLNERRDAESTAYLRDLKEYSNLSGGDLRIFMEIVK